MGNKEENEKRNDEEEIKIEETTEENVEKKDETEEIEQKDVEQEEEKEKTEFKEVKNGADSFEKQVEDHDKKQNKKIKIKRIFTSLFVIIILGLFFSTIFAIVNMTDETMIAGVSIEGVEVSGLNRDEATAKLNTLYKEKLETDVMLNFEDFETTINLELIQTEYNVKEIVEEAYKLGRNENIFIANFEIIKALITSENLEVKANIDEEIARQSIVDMEVNIPGVLIQSTYSIDEEDELLKISKGEAGYKIDVDKALELLKIEIEDINTKEMFISIPVIETEPNEIDIEVIYSEVYKEAKDAYIEKEPFQIYAETSGIDFDKEKALEILKEEGLEEYEIPLIIISADKTIADLGEDAFPDTIASYTTRYTASQTDRTTNLKIATSKINGKIIMPGEVFSYNQALGQRTIANGYKVASIYSAGEIVEGLGGGICQISTNLYNAALMSDLEIVERTNHQFVPSYSTAGRDATVVYGVYDFQFKNTRTYPVKIVAYMSNGISTVTIKGIEEENYKYSFSTNVIKVTSYSTQYEENPDVDMGKETVTQNGVNGQVVETYMTKTLNGKVVETTLISRDTYNPMVRIIERGTKPIEEESEIETEPEEEPEPEVEEETEIEEEQQETEIE